MRLEEVFMRTQGLSLIYLVIAKYFEAVSSEWNAGINTIIVKIQPNPVHSKTPPKTFKSCLHKKNAFVTDL